MIRSTGECDRPTTDPETPGAGDHACVREAAATWFARAQAGSLTAGQQRELAAWRGQAPSHEAEYQWLLNMWSALDTLPASRLQALCATPSAPLRRRGLLRYGLAASLMALAAGAGFWGYQLSSSSYQAAFATAPGERRVVTLPDGSTLELNSRSRVQVSFEADRRHVDLSEGEAMFSVAHDNARPFVVQAGPGQITVTGTRFDVRRDGEQARVAVESGHVQVQGVDPQTRVNLTAGQGTQVSAQGHVAAVQAVNAQALTAWRKGQLVFDNATLGEVAAEVSRYRAQPLQVSSPALAQLRVSSVFKVDDTDALLRALPKILPVAIRAREDGSQEIIAR